jgi:Spy/CpxP family protein refolding chaperone
MTRKKTALLGAALLVLLAVPALADFTVPQSPLASLVTKPGILTLALKLTRAQQDTLKGLLLTLQTAVKVQTTANATLDQQIRTALASPAPDNCAIGRLVVSRNQNDLAIVAAFNKFDKDFSAILTAEQLAKYQKLKNLLLHPGAKDAGAKDAETE